MWIGDLYIKPLHLLILVAAIVLIAVIFIIKKLICVIITAIILIVFIVGGNKFILDNQANSVSDYYKLGKKWLDIGKDKITELISEENISVKDGKVKIKLNGKWYDADYIKDNMTVNGDNVSVNIDGGNIPIKSEAISKFLGELNK